LFERPALAAFGLGLLVVTCSTALLALGAFQTLTALEAQAHALERMTLIALILGAIGGLAYLGLVRRAALRRSLVAAALLVLGFFYIHTSWMVTYAHGDIPVEMLVYVQSSPDVAWVSREIERIGFQTGQRKDLRILMDNGYTEVVGGQSVVHESVSWPFEWYLRDYKNRRYFTRTFSPDVDLKDYPAILVMAPNLDPIRDQLGDYVGQKYRLNWWYPEDYKAWQTNPGMIWTSLTDPVTRAKLLKYLVYRETLNPLGAREFYFFVRKEVPTLGPAPSAVGAPPARPSGTSPGALREGIAEAISPSVSLWGIGRSGDPLLAEPKGVAIGPDARLYVTEGRANRVTVFNPDGSIQASWGQAGAGEGQLAEPWGIAVSGAGEVFLADTWNHRIQKFDSSGRLLQRWGGLADTRGDVRLAPGQFWGPRDIAFGPDGLLYVSDTGNKRIQVFDAQGTFVRAFGGEGAEPGRFNEPVGLAFQGDTLLVADAWNGRIQRLDANGASRGSIAIGGWESKSILNKPYLATDHRGVIYVTAPERGQVLAISQDGTVQPLQRPSDRGARLGTPTGVEVGPRGELYVTESTGGVISVFSAPSGT
jgi:sugar lactone lactonase YvrE